MVIEWLKFQVMPDLREKFVQLDAEIWTALLASYAGFLGKEVWISPQDMEEIVLVIRWQTFEQWQAIPTDVLEQTEAQFREAMGSTYQMVDTDKYQLRKFA